MPRVAGAVLVVDVKDEYGWMRDTRAKAGKAVVRAGEHTVSGSSWGGGNSISPLRALVFMHRLVPEPHHITVTQTDTRTASRRRREWPRRNTQFGSDGHGRCWDLPY